MDKITNEMERKSGNEIKSIEGNLMIKIKK